MPSFDFVFGGYKQKNFDFNNKKSSDVQTPNNNKRDNSPITTFYANTKIYSPRSPRKYPKEAGKLCKKVFDDE